jgi:hypothetical protein
MKDVGWNHFLCFGMQVYHEEWISGINRKQDEKT